MDNRSGRQHNDPRSAALMALAMAIFGTIGIFRRMIPLSSAWVAFFRGAIGSIFLVIFVYASRRNSRRKAPDRGTMAKLILSGALIGINWALLFEAYNHTTVSVATLCYYMAPTFVIILSCIIFREKLTPIKAVCALASLAGMVLVSGVLGGGAGNDSITKAVTESGGAVAEAAGGLSGAVTEGAGGLIGGAQGILASGLSGEAIGVLLGLGAAVLYASVVLINKSIKISDPYNKTIVQLVSATVVLIPYLVLKDGAPAADWNIELIALLLTVGIVHTGLSYALYFGSMEGLKTHTVALFSYIDPVTALVLSHVILHEELTFLGILGGVLILGSAIISGLRD
ncbi:MAG: EamA family transporter [Eubacterium sp.]|nr:EamA family transporter [Eubacterium sp.]